MQVIELSDLVEQLACLELRSSSAGNLYFLEAERRVADCLGVLEVKAAEGGRISEVKHGP